MASGAASWGTSALPGGIAPRVNGAVNWGTCRVCTAVRPSALGDEAAVDCRPEVGRLSEEQAVDMEWCEAAMGDSDLCLWYLRWSCRQPCSLALMVVASRRSLAFSCSNCLCASVSSSVFSAVCSSRARRATWSRLAFSHLLAVVTLSRAFSSERSCTARSSFGASASLRARFCSAISLWILASPRTFTIRSLVRTRALLRYVASAFSSASVLVRTSFAAPGVPGSGGRIDRGRPGDTDRAEEAAEGSRPRAAGEVDLCGCRLALAEAALRTRGGGACVALAPRTVMVALPSPSFACRWGLQKARPGGRAWEHCGLWPEQPAAGSGAPVQLPPGRRCWCGCGTRRSPAEAVPDIPREAPRGVRLPSGVPACAGGGEQEASGRIWPGG
eukprot:CAMPEP_0175726720 /NCGR_PEP_ID=MMETSP0097-20121207/48409_1 /TAXON_ID=311494 /ORGANISM="Alexandrium monilatum, Strain CCMP3105" /LENGTH=386 /DNA_ID=CAMNT_0017034511 /DNA_START=33 /DNA_END=1189 /DNA_ORIENTATION=+